MASIRIRRGDTTNIAVNLTASGSPVDLTGATVYFTVRSSYADSTSSSDDSDALITKNVTSHDDATAGSTTIALTASDTDVADGSYKYDIQVKDSSNNITTYDIGDCTILPHVTVRTS